MKKLLWCVSILFSLVVLCSDGLNALSLNLDTLYNTYSLYDNDGGNLILLNGHVTDGPMVQLIWAGPNNVIDTVNPFTLMPSGDDEIIKDTSDLPIGMLHLGEGIPEGYGDGHIEAFVIDIDIDKYDAYDNEGRGRVYVRFFNVEDPVSSIISGDEVRWGHSLVMHLPEPDEQFLAELDFAPTGPLYTDNTYYPVVVPIPEPLTIITFIISSSFLLFHRRKKR